MSHSVRFYLLISFGCVVSLLPRLAAKADSQHYFFCEPTNSIYPYAQTCPVPWKEIDSRGALVQPAAAAPTQLASAMPPVDGGSAQHHVVAFPIGMPPPPAASPSVAAAASAALTPAVATVPGPEPAPAKGPTLFIYGADTPTIVCAVSQLCDLALQPGEKINHIILGDPDHWRVEPAEEGPAGSETLHLIIRPISPDLESSMIVLTKTRSYHVRLQSHRRDYMLQVAFSYPEAQASAAPAPMPVSAAQPDDDEGFVKVGDVTYVKGREPKALGSNKAAEPAPPAAVPRPPVSMTPTTP